MVKINKTKNYNLFKLMDSNRAVDLNHCKRLMKSIEENDKSNLNPIIVNSNMEIVDGQHRFHALMELGKDIYYVVDNNYSDKDIINLNTTSKLWNNEDYLEYYISKEMYNYVVLKKMMKHYGFSVSLALQLYVGESTSTRNNFKNGILHLANYKYMHEISDIILSLKSKYFLINKSLISVIKFLKARDDIDINLLLEKLDVYRKENLIHPKSSGIENLRFLQDVYNFRLRKPINLEEDYRAYLKKINGR